MTDTINVAAKGAVLPVLPKVTLTGETLELVITESHPENGYDADDKPVPSENMMVGVIYPDGQKKNHQVKNLGELGGAVTSFVQRRYNVESFTFAQTPSEMKQGQKFVLSEIQYQ